MNWAKDLSCGKATTTEYFFASTNHFMNENSWFELMENQLLELCTWIFRPVSFNWIIFPHLYTSLAIPRKDLIFEETHLCLLTLKTGKRLWSKPITKSVWTYFSVFTNYVCNVDIQLLILAVFFWLQCIVKYASLVIL